MKNLIVLMVLGIVASGCAMSAGNMAADRLAAAREDGVVTCAAGGREELTFRNAHPAGSVLDVLRLCFLIPSSATGTWTLPGHAVVRPNADRVTATLTDAMGKTRILSMDAWHTLEAQVPRTGEACVTLDGEPLAAWTGSMVISGTATFQLGGVRELHATAATAPYVLRDIPLPSARGKFARGEGRLPKGKSLDVAHGLKVAGSTPYTLVLRVTFPSSSMHRWRSLYAAKKGIDGAAFVNPNDGFGIAGQYPNVGLMAGTTHDIAIAYNGAGTSVLAWDGKVQVTATVPRAAITSNVFHLGCDDNGEDGEIEILNWCVYPAALDARQIASLKELEK